MAWAETDYAQCQQRPRSYRSRGVDIQRMDDHIDVRDKRNYAAAELYRLTGAAPWHQVFLQTTQLNQPNAQLYVWKSHEQHEAAWTYLNIDPKRVDSTVQQYCKQGLHPNDTGPGVGRKVNYFKKASQRAGSDRPARQSLPETGPDHRYRAHRSDQ